MIKKFFISFVAFACIQVNAQDQQTITIVKNENGSESVQEFKVPADTDVNTFLKEQGVDTEGLDLRGKETVQIKKKFKKSTNDPNKAMLGIMLAYQLEKAKDSAGVLKETNTLSVQGLVPGSSAGLAGVQTGDVILGFDGQLVAEASEVSAFMEAKEVGDEVILSVSRSGEALDIPIKLLAAGDLSFANEEWEEEIEFEVEIKENEKSSRQAKVIKVPKEDIEQFLQGENLSVDIEKEGGTTKTMIVTRTNDKAADCPEFVVMIQEISRAELRKVIKEEPVNSSPKSDLQVSDFQIAPNPNSGDFNLSFNLDERAETSVRILDMSGQQIFQEQLGNFSGSYSKDIRLQAKANKGVYIVQILRDDAVMSKRLVIN